tara:strand:+ start:870 stop:3143 length:2274 start_codon:yes stop_codon:yes gene_type:complete
MITSLDDMTLDDLVAIQEKRYDDVSLEALEWMQASNSGVVKEKPVIQDDRNKIGSVIKTTAEGGKFYRLGGGKVGYSSPDYSTTNQDDVKRMLRESGADDFKQPTDQAMSQQRQDIINQSPAFAKGVKATEGTFGIGSYVDEAAQAISPEFGSKVRAASNAMEIEKPIESIALQTIGTVVSSLPLGVAATLTKWGPTAAVAGITRGQKIIRGLFGGTVAGGTEGAVYGFGEGEGSFANRASSARSGAMFGAAPAAVLGASMPVFGDIIKRVLETDVKLVASTFGISIEAARVVKQAFSGGGNIDDAIANIRAAGNDGMLADAGDAADALIDAAAASGPTATQATQKVVGDRAEAASATISQTMDETLGAAPTGARTASEEISQRTAPARTKAYGEAYSKPIDYASDQGRAIEEVLSRISPKSMRQAIEEANADMLADGVKNKQIMATIADDGSISFSEMPNIQQLDYIKRSLGNMANDLKDPVTGALPSTAIRFGKLAGQLKKAIGDAVPEYNVAVKVGGDKIAEDEALDLGMKLLNPKTTREQVARQMVNASDAEKQAAKLGVRNHIDDTLANVKSSIATPDTDVKEAMKILADLSSRANLAKLRLIIGSKGVEKMQKELEVVRRSLTLRSAVAKNSATAQRQAIQTTSKAILNEGPWQMIKQGKPLESIKESVKLLTGSNASGQAMRESAMYTDVIKALTEKRGKDAVIALKIMDDAIKKQINLSDKNAEFITRVLMTQSVGASVVSGRKLNEGK